MDNPTVEIENIEGPIWIHADYRHKEMCKQTPGARWDADRKLWRVPLSWAACNQLRGIFGNQLEVGPNLRAWATADLEGRVDPAVKLRMATSLQAVMADQQPDMFLGGYAYDDRLYGFQQCGVAFLIVAGSAILADEMGTGKTIQMLTTLRELHRRAVEAKRPDLSPYPCLVVAPNTVKSVWKNENAVWNPGTTIEVIEGGAKKRRDALTSGADILVINYESTWRHSRLAPYGNIKMKDEEKEPKELNEIPFRTVILDEAHRTKNPRAKQTRACWAVGHLNKTVTRRYCLTGTPLANAPDELWSLLHFVDPDEWPARTKFVDRYCLQAWNPFGGMSVMGVKPDTKDELFKIVDPRMRRMPKDLVLPFLPPKVRSRRESEMTPKQQKAYKSMQATMAVELEDAIANSDNKAWTAATLPIVQRLRLMQFSSAYAYVDTDENVKLDFPSNKIDSFTEFIDELDADEPVVAFAESRQLIAMLGRKLEELEGKGEIKGATRYIVGGMSGDEREAAVADFQEGRARFILCTYGAGGEGITLTRARQCVFLQRSDSLIKNKQAEDRTHRIGSEVHTSVHLVDLVAPGTVEEEQIQNLIMKLERLQEIVRDKATLIAAAADGNPDAIAHLANLEAEENNLMAEDSISRAVV